MRILFVTGEYPAMQGGVGDYTRRLAQALGTLGEDVHVLTHVDAGADHLRTDSAAYEPTVYPLLGQHGWHLWGHTRRLMDEIQPDVVHIQYQSAAYGLHPSVNLLPWRLGLGRGRTPVFTTFHDLRVPYLFPKAGPLRWQSVLALAKGSEGSVATNPADWERLHHAGLGDRLHPIPIGSNIQCQLPAKYDRAAQRARWNAGPHTWLLCYFGFLNENKGGETLIRCLDALVRAGHPARLLMVGGKIGSSDPTNTAYLAHVERLIDELGLTERVQWTGFTSTEEVSANLAAADCAVLPYKEGASLRHGSLMAALAHALPIVSTHLAGNTSAAALAAFPMVKDGESALLVPPGEPIRLAEAVARVMAGESLRSHLSTSAAVLSRQFSWEAIAQRHLRAYAGRLS